MRQTTRCFHRLLLAMSLPGALAACSGEDDFPELPEGCQPLLAGHDCAVPYPSDFFRVEDATLPSGARVELVGAARSESDDGDDIELSDWRPTDGFSRLPLIVATLPDVVDPDGFVRMGDDLSASAQIDSQSIIVDTESGALVPHFVDVDTTAFEPTRRPIALHTLAGLAETRRYVVALRGVTSDDGELIAAPEGFRRLRDGEAADVPALADLVSHYEESVFPVLEEAGISREELQLAWDFTTGSDEHVTSDMQRVRELTRQWLDENNVAVEITGVEEDTSELVWRRIEGRITGPLFLTDAQPGATLVRGDDGQVAQNGTATVRFLLQVPVSVRDQFGPGRLLHYGHGFFGSRRELEGDSGQQIADSLATITIGIDWWGMSRTDLNVVLEDLTGNMGEVLSFTDRVHQAMANWMVMTAALETVAADPALRRPESGPGTSMNGEGMSNAGDALFDAEQPPYFLGISQGHILGGVLAAVHPGLERVVLNVGGAGLTHLMFRAQPFEAFMLFIQQNLADPLDRYAWVSAAQRHLDVIEPGVYARRVLDDPLAGAAERRVLLQAGLGDASFPNFGTYAHARALGIPLLTPAAEDVFGLEPVEGPVDSALSNFDYGIDTSFYREPVFPTEENDVHEEVRLTPSALSQIDAFLAPEGQVLHTCDGPCDPN